MFRGDGAAAINLPDLALETIMRPKLTAAIVLASFGTANARNLTIHPLAEIRDGPLPALVNIRARNAGLTIKSSVPFDRNGGNTGLIEVSVLGHAGE